LAANQLKQHREGVMHVATRAIFDQINQLGHKPDRRVDVTATVLEIIADQLNWLNWARQVADELIDLLLLDAKEAGVSPECLLAALSRRITH
jgi:hypothetical protein